MFLKCFFLANFQPHVSYKHVSYKKSVYNKLVVVFMGYVKFLRRFYTMKVQKAVCPSDTQVGKAR